MTFALFPVSDVSLALTFWTASSANFSVYRWVAMGDDFGGGVWPFITVSSYDSGCAHEPCSSPVMSPGGKRRQHH